jgi:uncharacterized low-complexity protein
MSNTTKKTPLVLAVSTALTIGLSATSAVNAAENPFGITDLSSGYMVVAEGKCGEGACGSKEGEGTCGGKSDSSEGKCGEGKCGGSNS